MECDDAIAETRANYHAALKSAGHLVTLRRALNGATIASADCYAAQLTESADEIVGAIVQYDRKYIVSAIDLENAGWPDVPKAGPNPDRLVDEGTAYAVVSVGNERNRWGTAAGKAVAFVIAVKG
jgi:hypothetical protein